MIDVYAAVDAMDRAILKMFDIRDSLVPKCSECGHYEHVNKCTWLVPCPGYAGKDCGCRHYSLQEARRLRLI